MSSPSPRTGAIDTSSSATVDFIASAARPFESAVDLEPLVRRLGRAQMVMLGEASHGTHEFYSVRAMITEQLVREHGFRAVAVEGDWPSSQPLNKYMRGGVKGTAQDALKAFEHYPSWMWNNKEIAELADRLRKYNDSVTPDQRVGFYGMDIYSMFPSMSKVLERLESLDPALAERARKRFSCFDPFECDAESYASSLITNPRGCRDQVVKILNDIFAAQMAAKKEAEQEGVTHLQSSSSSSSSSTASAMDADTEPVEGHSADTEGHSASSSTVDAHTSSFASSSSSSTEARDDEADDSKLWKFFDAEQNARIVKNAESYYRTMIMGSEDSWNVRDRHMMETLEILQQRYGKVVVWAHNTHVGDYRYTDMAKRGEINIGGLARERLGARADQVQLVGFSTFDGDVVASSFYGGPAYLMRVPQARAGSYDSLMHEAAKTIGAPQFFMSWEHEGAPEIRSGPLTKWRTQRAIGVVYNPAVERYGNYVPTSLAQRYDHVVYIDNTQAVESILPLNGKVGF